MLPREDRHHPKEREEVDASYPGSKEIGQRIQDLHLQRNPGEEGGFHEAPNTGWSPGTRRNPSPAT